jgi:hypothetical protein
MNIPSLALLLACLMLACSSGPSEGEGESPSEGEGEGEGEVDCTTITIGTIVLDGQDDTETSYSAPLTGDLGSIIVDDFLIMKFVNQGDRFVMPTGTFELGTGINANFDTCAECILVFEDQASLVEAPARVFSPTQGTITLDTDPRNFILRGSINNIVLREATIENFQTTFVAGGACVRFDDLTFDYKVVPSEWTCGDDRYRDGVDCDCNCGTEDPDCYQPASLLVGCAAGEICSAGVCAGPCDSLADEPTCEVGYCGPSGPFDVCTDDAALIDPADLGSLCAPIVGDPFLDPPPPYCAFEAGLVTGLCAYVGFAEERTCQRLCGTRDDCDAATAEDCIVIFSETFLRDDPGRGFCGNIVPAEWTCAPERYYDDVTCDCGCGTRDLDCDFGDLPVAGCNDGEQCSSDQRCVAEAINESCATAELVTPGIYNGDSTFAVNDVAYPGGGAQCGEDAADGNDLVYAVDVAVGQTLRVTAIGTANFFSPYLLIMGGDGEPCSSPLTQCLASSNSYGEPLLRVAEVEVTAANLGDGRFYIVVANAFDGAEGGAFTMTVEL